MGDGAAEGRSVTSAELEEGIQAMVHYRDSSSCLQEPSDTPKFRVKCLPESPTV